MAILTQHPYINEFGDADEGLVKFSSDAGKLLVQLETGNEYEEAIDVYPSRFNYIEKEDELSDALN